MKLTVCSRCQRAENERTFEGVDMTMFDFGGVGIDGDDYTLCDPCAEALRKWIATKPTTDAGTEVTEDEPLTLAGIMDVFEGILPCPPDPMPQGGSDAWYCWEATLHNSRHYPRVQRFVQMPEYQENPLHRPMERFDPLAVRHIISVECDKRGRGVRVLNRPSAPPEARNDE